jgi:hypothetical protein
MKYYHFFTIVCITLFINSNVIAGNLSDLDKQTFEALANKQQVDQLTKELNASESGSEKYFYINYALGLYFFNVKAFDRATQKLKYNIEEIDRKGGDQALIHKCQFLLAKIYEQKIGIENKLFAYEYFLRARGIDDRDSSKEAAAKIKQLKVAINHYFINETSFNSISNYCKDYPSLLQFEKVKEVCNAYDSYFTKKELFTSTLQQIKNVFNSSTINIDKLNKLSKALNDSYSYIESIHNKYTQFDFGNIGYDYNFWKDVYDAYIKYKNEEHSGNYLEGTYTKFSTIIKDYHHYFLGNNNSQLYKLLKQCKNQSLYRYNYISCNKWYKNDLQQKYDCFYNHIGTDQNTKNYDYLEKKQKSDFLYFMNYQYGRSNNSIKHLLAALAYGEKFSNEEQISRANKAIINLCINTSKDQLSKINEIRESDNNIVDTIEKYLEKSNQSLGQIEKYRNYCDRKDKETILKLEQDIKYINEFLEEYKYAKGIEKSDQKQAKKYYDDAYDKAQLVSPIIKLGRFATTAKNSLSSGIPSPSTQHEGLILGEDKNPSFQQWPQEEDFNEYKKERGHQEEYTTSDFHTCLKQADNFLKIYSFEKASKKYNSAYKLTGNQYYKGEVNKKIQLTQAFLDLMNNIKVLYNSTCNDEQRISLQKKIDRFADSKSKEKSGYDILKHTHYLYAFNWYNFAECRKNQNRINDAIQNYKYALNFASKAQAIELKDRIQKEKELVENHKNNPLPLDILLILEKCKKVNRKSIEYMKNDLSYIYQDFAKIRNKIKLISNTDFLLYLFTLSLSFTKQSDKIAFYQEVNLNMKDFCNTSKCREYLDRIEKFHLSNYK